MNPPDPSRPSPPREPRVTLEEELRSAERKLALIRRKQTEIREWDRSRRPIRIGFFVAIPIVLLVEAIHLYRTLDSTQGRRAPWLMLLATAGIAALSFWYYREARNQRDRVFRGFDRAAGHADLLERRIEELRRTLGPASSTDTGRAV